MTGNEGKINLAGEWRFKMDTANVGIEQQWFKQTFTEKANLPGSMNTNGKGFDVDINTPWTGSMWNNAWYESKDYEKYRKKDNIKVVFWLQPDKYYTGVAWYQRKITIPQEWKDKQIILTLERCHWVTGLWIDKDSLGNENSLATPHRYYLMNLKPGEHTLNIRIDNKVRDINPGLDAHSISDNTQSNWNGIAGTIALEEHPLAFIESVKITPDIANRQITAEIQIQSLSDQGQASLYLQAANKVNSLEKKKFDVNIQAGENTATLTYPMGENPMLWDEFNPNLYVLHTELQSKAGDDQKETMFGMREMSTKGAQITVNGKPVFIRGTLECCIFPKTGFPPTDVADWMREIKVCKSYGLNSLRFHSWCPPEAAFIAADSLGFYFHIECDAWTAIGNGAPIDQFVMDESERIVREYGNHPSFCMLLYGNEPAGPNHVAWLTEFVKHWKAKDRRFLVSTAAGWPEIPESDWLCTPKPRIQGWGEGVKSIINSAIPSADYDWSDRISKTQPTISHEIGQWCVYPNLQERSKYTGAFKAKNFDIFEDRLKESGLLNLADSFFIASGKLQTLCYKADIEAALRTKNFGGFQLLSLQDFPGQGSAIEGVVDPFWDSKPYVTPEQYSQFCNRVVPLIRTKRFIYASGETFDAKVEVAQFAGKNLDAAKTTWKLKESSGKEVATGEFTCDLPAGTLTEIGEISQKITTDIPKQYRIEVSVDNYANGWDLWVYPSSTDIKPKDVKVVTKLDDATASFLEKGGKVLLIPAFGSMRNEGKDSVVVGFSSIFWNTLWTNNQAPHTLGILCDPKHPALSLFPTDFYSNYQWQYAMSHCNAIPLHKLGDNIRPIVRIIDDWFTARSLGMIVELKVGEGKILICSADLNTTDKNRPEAQQLKNSLLNYMESADFNPVQTTAIENVRSLFK